MPFSKFASRACLLFLFTLLASLAIIIFEFSYGNADGIWLDLEIKTTFYYLCLIEAGLFIVIYIIFYASKAVNFAGVSLIMTILMFMGLELLCGLVIPAGDHQRKTNIAKATPFMRPDYTESFVEDNILGVKAKPNWHFAWRPAKGNIQYDSVKISIDSLSRRITALKDSIPRTRYGLFFGCSYTYGDGVSDNETIPYYFQSSNTNYQCYNYGFLAYSPLHMLARLQNFKLNAQIPQNDGFAVFVLINDHLDRIIPATRWIELTKGKFPYFREESSRTDGTFESNRRIYTYLTTKFQASNIKQIIKWGYPKFHTKAHNELLVQIIKQSKLEYQKQFGNNNFFVLIFPGNPISNELREIFKTQNIKLVDYAALLDIKTQMLPFDAAHPNALVYKTVADRLSKDIDSILVNK